MDWSEIIDNPYLEDLPFRIEQDAFGNILMSPASNWHNRRQFRIARRLEDVMGSGEVFQECSIQTSKGVKVPDVVWQSAEHYAVHGDTTPMSVAPEICVEVLSPSYSRLEMDEKRSLYFAAGAREVWVCDKDGRIEFFSPAGSLKISGLAPDFPTQVG